MRQIIIKGFLILTTLVCGAGTVGFYTLLVSEYGSDFANGWLLIFALLMIRLYPKKKDPPTRYLP
jgi:hypothetical protein